MELLVHPQAICKVLSANDTGETGGHQAGILVPKDEDILSFFPQLGKETKNPRCVLRFEDLSGAIWNFTYIYYNNKFYKGTRNEFRLTSMTGFIKSNNLKAGDKIIFLRLDDGRLLIKHQRTNKLENDTDNVLRLGTSWKVVNI
ncbi:EcoRII N-terminal effector-binding domain-containing protein [Cohnella mopanensis]|uniref:EcoRII N-terminal effector-binding domain-containing protein n=1 Tax=Cohnella mopanensis TaxID=2911966 RepID=UPI001EF80DEA|nr:EcoRII N-terminal effector-binding domain-containing protein [Cohnella mopanensis]